MVFSCFGGDLILRGSTERYYSGQNCPKKRNDFGLGVSYCHYFLKYKLEYQEVYFSIFWQTRSLCAIILNIQNVRPFAFYGSRRVGWSAMDVAEDEEAVTSRRRRRRFMVDHELKGPCVREKTGLEQQRGRGRTATKKGNIRRCSPFLFLICPMFWLFGKFLGLAGRASARLLSPPGGVGFLFQLCRTFLNEEFQPLLA